jgi:hypothetical protein
MALTDAQKLDVRRWMGYATQNQGEPDLVYSTPSGNSLYSQSLSSKLDGLTASEESVLTDTYLANIATLETDILNTRTNLDTDTAGPWIANKREMAQRVALFNKWRRDMCGFLGFTPGPALGDGGIALVRC